MDFSLSLSLSPRRASCFMLSHFGYFTDSTVNICRRRRITAPLKKKNNPTKNKFRWLRLIYDRIESSLVIFFFFFFFFFRFACPWRNFDFCVVVPIATLAEIHVFYQSISLSLSLLIENQMCATYNASLVTQSDVVEITQKNEERQRSTESRANPTKTSAQTTYPNLT